MKADATVTARIKVHMSLSFGRKASPREGAGQEEAEAELRGGCTVLFTHGMAVASQVGATLTLGNYACGATSYVFYHRICDWHVSKSMIQHVIVHVSGVDKAHSGLFHRYRTSI